MVYPTKTELKDWLGISGASEDTQMDIIMNGAVATMEMMTNRVWVAASSTKVIPLQHPFFNDRGDRRVLSLFQDLNSITSITNGDGVLVAATEYDTVPIAAPYYQIILRPESAKIWLKSSVGAGVSINGSWGASSDVPADIKQLLIELGAYRYRLKQNSNAGATMTVNKSGAVTQVGDTPQYIKDAFTARTRRSA